MSILCLSVSAARAEWAAKMVNPEPMPDDLILPMPCDGAMAFRRVLIPADGPLGDRAVMLGSPEPGHGYAEGPRRTWIAGSLPGGAHARAYWIAKYEVGVAQWAAVMEKTCPSPSMAGRLAKGDVSWFDAVRFSELYSEWLLTHAAKALPRNGDEPAFVRPPTEAEWEYAARGGASVSDADFQEPTFPMPEGMPRYVWFAGTQSANGKPQLTGLLKPNPLGLFDVLGNMDEVVLSPFRLNKLGRAHGAAGGFVVRGGNYLTAQADVRTAMRAEVPYFDASGPRRAKTTGFRPVLAAPVLGSAAELKAARDAWEKLGDKSAPDAAPRMEARSEDPVTELERIAKAAPTTEMKVRLERLRSDLRANIAARDEQSDRAVRTTLRLGAFLGRKLKDDGLAIDALADLIKARSPDSDLTRKWSARLAGDRDAMADNLRYYADTVIHTAEDYGEDRLKRQADLLETELNALGLKDLVPFVGQHLKHVLAYRKDMRVSRERWLNDWKTLN